MVDQLQWGERERSGAVALGSRQPVDDLLLIDELETLERERRAGTVTEPERDSLGPQRLALAAAGVREPSTFQHDVADANALALQCDKVDPGDDEVAAQYRRRNLLATGQRRDDIDLRRLFARIDAMPMRRREMEAAQ
ncbi:MAG: DUF4174 domain-containing protein [Thiohalocapsa sp.]|uniref:hypothetical protein n=1 Tax=Thiohalocapsa sp. TaxID=2497641 RepID=UPI0025E13E5E|nr:hypothetical protein [Thiohalocapsa sp.]MCG6941060.1 DUF4174 domain-containing protein [Thiohalocapsa sp.]